jgi:Tfp pilus assembly pilus retraction ATPase PilT
MAAIAWDRLLETCCRRHADVMLLTAGCPPMLHIEGIWRTLQTPPLEPGDVKAMATEVLDPKPEQQMGYAYSDFWYGDVAFFRAMAFGYPETTLLIVSPTAQTRQPPADPRSLTN